MFKLSNYFSKQEEAAAPEAPQGGAAVDVPPTPEAPAAPEQQPTPEPDLEPEPEPEPQADPVPESGEEYADTFYGYAAELFDNHNLNGQPVVDYFEEHGEFHPDHVAKMEAEMGKGQAHLLLEGIKNENAKAIAQIEADNAAIYDSVGGQENFDASVAWIQSEDSGWTDEEKADMNKLLDMGGNIGQWAAQLMWIGYSNAGNPEAAVTDKPVIRDGTKAQASTPEPISLREYSSALKAAKTQSEVDALVKRANFTRTTRDAVDLGWKFG